MPQVNSRYRKNQYFSESSTWLCPDDVHEILLIGSGGAGGGGGGSGSAGNTGNSATASTGVSGGNTTFSDGTNTTTFTGGAGGAGGAGSAGINQAGNPGGSGKSTGGMNFGKVLGNNMDIPVIANLLAGGGGLGGNGFNVPFAGSYGGRGGLCYGIGKRIRVIPGVSYTVTIGVGGNGGAGSAGGTGVGGTPGVAGAVPTNIVSQKPYIRLEQELSSTAGNANYDGGVGGNAAAAGTAGGGGGAGGRGADGFLAVFWDEAATTV